MFEIKFKDNDNTQRDLLFNQGLNYITNKGTSHVFSTIDDVSKVDIFK